MLKDGRRIHDVIIGGDAICKIGQTLITSESDLDFSVSDIKDVKRATRWTALMSVSPLPMVKSLTIKHLAIGYLFIGFGYLALSESVWRVNGICVDRLIPRKSDSSFLVVYRSCVHLALGFVLGFLSPILLTHPTVLQGTY